MADEKKPGDEKPTNVGHLRKVMKEVRETKSVAKKVEQLLEPTGEESPIAQLQEILEALLHSQRLLSQRVEDLHDKTDAQSTRRA